LRDAAYRANSSLYDAAASLPGRTGATVAGFIRLIETLRKETAKLSLPEVIEHLIEESGLRAHYLSEKEGGERLENLDELINAATVFLREEEASGTPSETDPLTSFLAHASLEAGEHQAGENQEAVQLMTVHAAKGLEFDTVFITGLEQGLFPHEGSASGRDGQDGLAEERRLMYVAMTRACRRLYLTHTRTRMLHGQIRYCVSSLFLEELPMELLQPVGFRPGYAMPPVRSEYAADKPVRNAVADVDGFRVGRNVRHARFGLGVIVTAEGRGDNVNVQVNFDAHGMKWLTLNSVTLEAA
jgi:DNA helicase-2/ATP-dependent DNA helicase PcrA